MKDSSIKKYCAEFVGTMVLVLFGCGSAVFGSSAGVMGWLGVAFAFGLSIVAMAYSIGNVSGCHINPAVSFAMLITKRMNLKDFLSYVCAQILGAIAGAGLLKLILSIGSDTLVDLTGGLGSNGIAAVGIGGALVVEILLTFTFVVVILGVTSKKGNHGSFPGLVIGLSLTLIHILGIPLTGTSVNPARSIGPAIFAGGDALTNVWVFIVAPLVGAAIAAYFSMKVLDSEKAK